MFYGWTCSQSSNAQHLTQFCHDMYIESFPPGFLVGCRSRLLTCNCYPAAQQERLPRLANSSLNRQWYIALPHQHSLRDLSSILIRIISLHEALRLHSCYLCGAKCFGLFYKPAIWFPPHGGSRQKCRRNALRCHLDSVHPAVFHLRPDTTHFKTL